MNHKSGSLFIKTTLLTTLALIAFAANSVLSKLALGDGLLDASSFTMIRLFTGAFTLLFIISIKKQRSQITSKGSLKASVMLFIYAITFSFGYLTLDTGTGALILFAAVQATMIIQSILSGNRLNIFEWVGILTAFLGFIYLVLPGANAPSPIGFLLMTISGITWAFYTLIGQNSTDPLSDTGYNFLRTIPLVIILGICTLGSLHFSTKGIILATVSGAIASGLGYTIWYLAIKELSVMQAAALQLLVPVISAVGGIIFMSELLSSRLILSSILILGGIMLVLIGKNNYILTTFKLKI